MFGASGWLGASAMAKANKEIKEKELANSILAWWEEHKDDMYIDSLDRDCDYKIYPKEPEFVRIAKDLIGNKSNVF